MDRRLRNRILLCLLVAGVLAFVLIELSGRKPAAKISAVMPTRENLASSIASNGKSGADRAVRDASATGYVCGEGTRKRRTTG